MSVDNSQAPSNHWHILGAGAIGSLFASWLQERASIIVNPQSEYALQNEIILTIKKQNQSTSLKVASSIAKHANNIQNLLICTKANHTEKALEGLVLSDNCNIVLLQNGMGNVELLKKRFPKCRIFCGSTTHGAFRTSPTHTVHAGEGSTYIGSLNKNITTESIQNICHSLSSKNQTVLLDTNIEKRLWIKLAMNCAINPLTVIYQCKNGQLLDTDERLAHLKRTCLELDKVLRLKKTLSEKEDTFSIVKKVAQDTANNYSSMFQDNKNKHLSEIDFIQGYLLKEAQGLALQIPENQNLYDTIKKIEADY